MNVINWVSSRKSYRTHEQQQIGNSSHKHTKTNLYRCLGLFTYFSKPTEKGNTYWGKNNHKAGVEVLKNRS